MGKRAARCSVIVAIAVAGLVATGGVAGAQDTTTPEPSQASDTVTGLPIISGTLEDDSIRVLIENCEVGSAIVRIDGIEVATVTITMDVSGAEAPAVEAAATGEVVVAIPEGATPPYDVEVECINGTATTVVDVPEVPGGGEGSQVPGAGGADGGDGSLPVTGGGSTLVPLARGAALAVAVGAILVLVARQRREHATA